jgi:hypothetical protein
MILSNRNKNATRIFGEAPKHRKGPQGLLSPRIYNVVQNCQFFLMHLSLCPHPYSLGCLGIWSHPTHFLTLRQVAFSPTSLHSDYDLEKGLEKLSENEDNINILCTSVSTFCIRMDCLLSLADL